MMVPLTFTVAVGGMFTEFACRWLMRRNWKWFLGEGEKVRRGIKEVRVA